MVYILHLFSLKTPIDIVIGDYWYLTLMNKVLLNLFDYSHCLSNFWYKSWYYDAMHVKKLKT